MSTSGEQSVSVPKLLSCQQAAGSANRMQRKEVEIEMSARKNDVQTKSRQQEGLSRFKDDKRKPDQETVASSGRQRCREQEMSRTKTSKRSRSQQPGQPGGQGLILYALPCLCRLFPFSKLPSPGLPGLYWYHSSKEV